MDVVELVLRNSEDEEDPHHYRFLVHDVTGIRMRIETAARVWVHKQTRQPSDAPDVYWLSRALDAMKDEDFLGYGIQVQKEDTRLWHFEDNDTILYINGPHNEEGEETQ